MTKVRLTEEDFEVKRSTIKGAGKGLFARTTIRPEEHIGYYTGRILSDAEAESDPYVSSRYMVWVCKDCWIYGEGPEANYTRYINHSEKPNAELVTSSRWKTARIVALKRIRPGEEILFNYGEEYWDVVNEAPNER